MDLLFGFPPAGPAAFDGIMVTVDTHSHWMICTPCHEQASARESAILFHDDVIAPRGMPLAVTSDRDTRWRSVDGIWQQAIQMAGGAMRLTPAQHHHSNLVERSIRQLVEHMRTGCRPDQLDWLAMLPSIVAAINFAPSRALGGISPYYVEFGHHPRLPFDNKLGTSPSSAHMDIFADIHRSVRQRRIQAAEARKRVTNANRPAHVFKVGDPVYISAEHWSLPSHAAAALKKFKDKYFGPYPVEEVIDNDYAIRVALPAHLKQVWPVMHPWHLRPAVKSSFRQKPIQFLSSDPNYEVEELIAEKMIRKKRHFLVKFKDYGPQYMMWLPESKITAKRLISLFWQKKKNAPNEQPTLAAYMSSTSAWPVCHDLHSHTIGAGSVRVKTSATSSITARIRSSSARNTFVAASFSDDFLSANAITKADSPPLSSPSGPIPMNHRCLSCGLRWRSATLLRAHLHFKDTQGMETELGFEKRGCKHSLV